MPRKRIRRCALPGCDAPIRSEEGRPVRKYCTPDHRAEARQLRRESTAVAVLDSTEPHPADVPPDAPVPPAVTVAAFESTNPSPPGSQRPTADAYLMIDGPFAEDDGPPTIDAPFPAIVPFRPIGAPLPVADAFPAADPLPVAGALPTIDLPSPQSPSSPSDPEPARPDELPSWARVVGRPGSASPGIGAWRRATVRGAGTIAAAARAQFGRLAGAGAHRRAVAAVMAVAVVSGGGQWVAREEAVSGAVPTDAPAAIPADTRLDTAAWSGRGRVVLASIDRQLAEIASIEQAWNGLPAERRGAAPAELTAMLERRDVLLQHKAVLTSALSTIQSLDGVGQDLAQAQAELAAIDKALAQDDPGDETARRLLADQRAARVRQRDAKLAESAALTEGVRSTMAAPMPDLEPSTRSLADSVLGIIDGREPEPATPAPSQVLAVTPREGEQRPRQDVTIGGPLEPDPEDEVRGARSKPAERGEPRGPVGSVIDGLTNAGGAPDGGSSLEHGRSPDGRALGDPTPDGGSLSGHSRPPGVPGLGGPTPDGPATDGADSGSPTLPAPPAVDPGVRGGDHTGLPGVDALPDREPRRVSSGGQDGSGKELAAHAHDEVREIQHRAQGVVDGNATGQDSNGHAAQRGDGRGSRDRARLVSGQGREESDAARTGSGDDDDAGGGDRGWKANVERVSSALPGRESSSGGRGAQGSDDSEHRDSSDHGRGSRNSDRGPNSVTSVSSVTSARSDRHGSSSRHESHSSGSDDSDNERSSVSRNSENHGSGSGDSDGGSSSGRSVSSGRSESSGMSGGDSGSHDSGAGSSRSGGDSGDD